MVQAVALDRVVGAVHAERRVGALVALELSVVQSQEGSGSQKKRPRKSSAVYEDMKRRILVGDLDAESPITEQSLAQNYGCSQSTIREALLTLQEDGLVIRRGYQGTFVTRTTNEEAVILLRLRLNIETAAIGLVLDKMTPALMAELRDLANAYEEARLVRDKFAISLADAAFHRALLRVADMPILEPVLMRTLLHLHRFIITSHQDNMVWAARIEASHAALLDAIESGDKEAATQVVIAHATANTIEVKSEIREKVFARV